MGAALDLRMGFGQRQPVTATAVAEPPDDAALVAAARAGDRSAFGRLYERYARMVHGILLARVLYRKTGGEKKFVIVDAGMNDLIRPALYESFHFIWPAKTRAAENVPKSRDRGVIPSDAETVDVVGPICESGDFLAKDRALPPTERGDLLAVFTAGAYGFAMSSNYNNRPRVAEVLVDGSEFQVIRKRETYDDLVALEM